MWRIKTFKEFGNKRPFRWNSFGGMDYLYGLLVNDEQQYENSVPKRSDLSDTWLLESSDFVELKGFTEKPIDVKVGDQFIVVKKDGLGGSNFLPKKLNIGDIVTLNRQDNSICPEFTWDDNYQYLDWGHLDYYYGSVEGTIVRTPRTFPNKPRPNAKEGEVYKIVIGVRAGESIILKQNDGSTNPYFWNASKSDYDCISWCKIEYVEHKEDEQLSDFKDQAYPDEEEGTEYVSNFKNDYFSLNEKIVLVENDKTASPLFKGEAGQEFFHRWCWVRKIKEDKTSSEKETNLNLNSNVKKSNSTTTGESILHRISPTISKGTASRGVAVSSSRGKILLGS